MFESQGHLGASDQGVKQYVRYSLTLTREYIWRGVDPAGHIYVRAKAK